MSHIFTLKRDDPRIDQLILFLKDRGWLTRKQIADRFSWNIRDVSAVVQASEGEILATQKGFKLTIQCSREEWEESDHSIGGQITNNTTRRANQASIFHSGTKRACLKPKEEIADPYTADLFGNQSQSAYGTGA